MLEKLEAYIRLVCPQKSRLREVWLSKPSHRDDGTRVFCANTERVRPHVEIQPARMIEISRLGGQAVPRPLPAEGLVKRAQYRVGAYGPKDRRALPRALARDVGRARRACREGGAGPVRVVSFTARMA